MADVSAWLATWGDNLWTWLVLPIVVLLGLYFTVRSGVVQFRLIPEMFRTLTDKTPRTAEGRPQSVSAFQAFTISAASRVGVGNIAGVGTAIAIGGPGAVFWMWLMAFIGGASAFIESSLAQLYKTRDADGFRGGPAYYMQRGLRARWMGVVFAVILIICFPVAFSSLQANTIQATIAGGLDDSASAWLPWVIGIVLSALMALVIFGGVRRIASVTQLLVPLMALLYLLIGLVIVALNIDRLPAAVATIFTQAFGPNEVVGATLGYIILTGVKRGMFSNEAGLGSAPNAGASAAVTHPVKQGLVQTLGVYFDTFLVCSITAFIILVSVPDLANAERGIDLTQGAVIGTLGEWSNILLSVIIFLLAFSSILGNYYYGESNIEFITRSRGVLLGYRIAAIAAVLIGALLSADVVWTFADGAMGFMALVNLVAIGLLSGIAFALLRDYTQQRREGKDPVFTRDRLPGVANIEMWEDELSVTGPIDLTTRGRQAEKHRDHLHERSARD
ncbi:MULTISPECIES: sodium:alanine symporter family protein [unclassified Microbacterium]|jgi:AGCS family alanine or glycine:cation symporter|uniref:alanine/glycine:cation symporter family protein n=1 Tax=unclassified Microbacterium TaxID=2609290 RepID=UPI000C4A17F1|nr:MULTISPECIES: alanine/glycine:cation symporter family protein [unclassified Microbacterium]MAY51622.1 sodium:alanine symporter family protein [Microbacterium sp.]HBR90181.1 sodium:alanine symporter family protein [Microbacterium sp.]|tara:strand:- start:16955 stop:18466 length:1512 start_codon:yes stop_codon:yes gene_type:complete